jgi:hypothetical protein
MRIIVDSLGNFHPPQSHAFECPVEALPRIVAALEAAERAINDGPYAGAYPGLGPNDPSAGCAMCGFCGEPTTRAHLKDCTWQALVAALRGAEMA